MITADQVRSVTIARKIYGYSISSVDRLLDEIEAQLREDVWNESALLDKNESLRKINQEKQDAIVRLEDQLASQIKKIEELEALLAAKKGSPAAEIRPLVVHESEEPEEDRRPIAEIRKEIAILNEKVHRIETRLGMTSPTRVPCKPKKVSKIRMI